MTAIELPFCDPVQPYFAAYANALGVAPGDIERSHAANARYIGWILRQWAAWCDLTGTDREGASRFAAEFAAWLAAEYPERAS